MSSNTPTIDSLPFDRYHLNPPGRLPVVPTFKDYSLASDNTPDDAPPIPTRSHRHKQPKKLAIPRAGLPSPEPVASTGKYALNDIIRIPRTARAHLPTGLRAEPKIHSGLTPASDHKQSRPNVPQVSDEKSVDIWEDNPTSLQFSSHHGELPPPEPYHHPHDRSLTPPSSDKTSLEILVIRTAALAQRLQQLSRERQPLEQEFAAFLEQTQADEQQEYGSERYPQVQVQQFPQVQQVVVHQQQHHPVQAQQNVFPQQQQQQQQIYPIPTMGTTVPIMSTPTLTLSPKLDLLQDLDMGNEEDYFSIYGSDMVLEEGNIDTSSPLATEVDQAETGRYMNAQFARSEADSGYRPIAAQLPAPYFERQQQQQQFYQAQQAVVHQQQQQWQPPIEVQQGVYMVYDPVTQSCKYVCDPLQNNVGGDDSRSAGNWSFAGTPKLPDSLSQSTETMKEDRKRKLQAARDAWRAPISTPNNHQQRAQRAEEPRNTRRRSFSMPPLNRRALSLPPDSAASSRLSRVVTECAFGSLQLGGSFGPETVSSTASDVSHALGADSNNGALTTIAMPPALGPVVPIFAEARQDLWRLQDDIRDLSDDSDSSSEASGSGSGTPFSPEQCNDHMTNNVHEDTVADSGKPTDLRINTDETGNSSGSLPAHKRSKLDENNEDNPRAQIGVSRKRTKLSSFRFVCCFHNGPGRNCSGTDETISEVLKKLSEQHDTHVCDRCWVLKIKDETSGLYVHPNDDQECRDHCLSPHCHKTSPTIGHRHEFDQSTCGTKTSRVRPGDSEAVYRFIFRLVHPAVNPPSSVLTPEHRLHLDAVPRQSRRKLNREELRARANDLEKRLESGEHQNMANAIRIMQLEQQLADAHRATKAAEEKSAAFEKQNRRSVAMLSDALRTGVFPNTLDHQSLLRRVEEDAPGALIHQSQAFMTPSASDRSRNSSATPVRDDVVGQDLFSRPATTYERSTVVAPLQTIPGDHTMDGYISGALPGDPDVDPGWLDIFDDPGDSDITVPQI